MKDSNARMGENYIFELFLASSGCEAIMIMSVMSYLSQLEHLMVDEISKMMKITLQPKKKIMTA